MPLIRVEAQVSHEELLKAVDQLSPLELNQFIAQVIQLRGRKQTAERDGGNNPIRPIEDELRDLAQAVPLEDWNRLPTDLTDHLDHYLYGTPKR